MNYFEGIVEQLFEKLAGAGLRLIYAAFILAVGLKVVKFVLGIVKKGRGFARIDATASTFILSLLRILGNALVVITAAVVLGIPMTSFITVLASCGVAVGLALQGSLANFAGGLMLLIFKPFKAGDFIEASGYEGTVKAVSVFYTVITTTDNKVVTLPNGSLTAAAVVNYSACPTRRISFRFDAAYCCDTDRVKSALIEAACGNEFVLPDPAPAAYVEEHKESSVGYLLHVWCEREHYWDVKHAIPERVKQIFDRDGIEIPFPQVEVRGR